SRTPGYPILIAAWHKLFAGKPSVVSVRMLNAILGACTVVAIGILATLLFDRGAGVCAAILASIYPGGIVMSILILSEGPFSFVMTLQLLAFYYVLRNSSSAKDNSLRWRAALLTGVAAAVAVLIRPSWLLFTPLLLLAAVLLCSSQRKKLCRQGILIMLAFCVTMSPWWVRNYRVVGHFVPTTLQVGASLYDGLHENATGGSDMSFVLGFYRAQNIDDAKLATPPADSYEFRLNNRMRNAALNWAGANPTQVLALAGNKFVRLWRPLASDKAESSVAMRWGMAVGYVGVVALALYGLMLLIRRRKSNQTDGSPSTQAPVLVAVLLSISPAIYFTALHMVFVSSIRYRQPAVLVLTLLAGLGLSHGLQRCAFGRRLSAWFAASTEGGIDA
ncbi:MAG: glycosyltransferase family 39 protein, partial [Pirellulaceae bacterium]|nr:glycosyltransferase family 39 protein [Pirellulaceae bacterium]